MRSADDRTGTGMKEFEHGNTHARKYFFFDIDGTLTNRETGKIVPSAALALKKLRSAGHFVAINTGRAYYKARKFFEENGFDNMVCNGGAAIVIDGKLVENSPLPYGKARELYDQALAGGFGVLVADEDSERVATRDFTFYDQCGIRREPTVYYIDENYDPDDRGVIYKLYIAYPQSKADVVQKELPALRDLGYMWFVPEYILVQHDEKKRGILRMLELVGGSAEDVVVFGDDTNDMDMFAPEFYKVAMGNGNEALKAVADEVAPANLDDGIYKTCERHGWFEKID